MNRAAGRVAPKGDWWRTFFRPEIFPIEDLVPAAQTAMEVRALRRLLPPAPSRILDVGCGTGRHSVALARLGYEVTGADQSLSYLARARECARRARAHATFVRRDMRRLGFESAFDAVTNLWTSFGYFGFPEQDLAALRSMRRALRPGGRLILEMVDGRRVRDEFLPRNWSEARRGFMLQESRWREGRDPGIVTLWTYVGPDGSSRSAPAFLRYYDARRLKRALETAGFRRVRVRPGLLEPRASPLSRKRLLAVAWKDYELARVRS